MKLTLARHAGAIAVLMLLAGGADAQTQPAPAPASTSPAPAAPQADAEQRINALQAQLHITDQQKPQWDAFAKAMRDNASSTDALFRQRASATANMTALENMKSYAQVARAYADNTDALARSFETLYDVLTPQQRQTIDGLFRQQQAQASAGTGASQPYKR